MSGFALVFNQNEPLAAESPVFVDFVQSVADYKSLDRPAQVVTGERCAVAKFDSPSTLHRGITLDQATGSWLLAAGTLIDNAHVDAQGSLQRLLTDYLAQGDGIFDRLDGHFALVICDGREGSVRVVSDPFGLISIYYAQQGKRFFVSTSALAVAKAVGAEPGAFEARSFILYGGNFGEATLWQDVYQLWPANILTLNGHGAQKSSYWSFGLDQTVAGLSLNGSIEHVVGVLSETMRYGLAREGKAWLSLTGGFDSRVLAAMMHHCELPFKSYCHGAPDSRDVRLASQVSQAMGWEHQYFPLPEDWGTRRVQWLERTLGHTDALLDVLKTSRIIREQTLKSQHYPVSLWGYGGEIYRGFYWKQEFLNVGNTSTVNYDRLLDYRITPVDWPILKDTPGWIRSIRDELKLRLMTIGEQQPDWPNTVKLDLIGDHLERTLSGATISAVMGLQRAISPFDFKSNMACVLSVNHKWRAHSRLFRLMLELINPALTAIETADGGPASPMRLGNLHQFVPYWWGVGEKLAWKMSRRFLGTSLWRKKDPGKEGKASYPRAQWRRDTLSQLNGQDLLVPARMHSASLYDRERLQALLAEAQTDQFRYDSLLSRIITLELALRSVGTSF